MDKDLRLKARIMQSMNTKDFGIDSKFTLMSSEGDSDKVEPAVLIEEVKEDKLDQNIS
eukprot:CAMPEP_0116884856 /NCGR_PEP_ID=MMETSP0463-20121206/17931_1 /TAXON_ID=181622 /ORGANISM="Strombidinopsis sp, Strain SopsisLIS2011" /LENGTH=57 /DNA_ID=CAMNT_0004542145 /DNA_START=923 /DNA_END=1096 /DNA_ORIENTATION=-